MISVPQRKLTKPLKKHDRRGARCSSRTLSAERKLSANWQRCGTLTDGVLTSYLYDGDNVIADIDASGNLVRSYVCSEMDQNISLTAYGTETVTSYYNADGRWSVVNLTDAIGAVVNEYAYSAYGDAVDALTGGSVEQRYTYTGRELSGTSGAYYFRYRWYGADIGGFYSRDTLDYVDGMSLYAGFFAYHQTVDAWGLEEDKPCIDVALISMDAGISQKIIKKIIENASKKAKGAIDFRYINARRMSVKNLLKKCGDCDLVIITHGWVAQQGKPWIIEHPSKPTRARIDDLFKKAGDKCWKWRQKYHDLYKKIRDEKKPKKIKRIAKQIERHIKRKPKTCPNFKFAIQIGGGGPVDITTTDFYKRDNTYCVSCNAGILDDPTFKSGKLKPAYHSENQWNLGPALEKLLDKLVKDQIKK